MPRSSCHGELNITFCPWSVLCLAFGSAELTIVQGFATVHPPCLCCSGPCLCILIAFLQSVCGRLACRSEYYCEIHTPGTDHSFKVRGASYLTDGHKVQAGQPVFELMGMEVVDTGGAVKLCRMFW